LEAFKLQSPSIIYHAIWASKLPIILGKLALESPLIIMHSNIMGGCDPMFFFLGNVLPYFVGKNREKRFLLLDLNNEYV
jgi:hypothetical protein